MIQRMIRWIGRRSRHLVFYCHPSEFVYAKDQVFPNAMSKWNQIIASSLWGIAEKEDDSPADGASEGTTTALDSPPSRSKSSGGTYPEKRAPKNGEIKGRGPSGSKKKR